MQSWLKLPNGNRPLVIFWDEVLGQPAPALQLLAGFLRLEPAVLDVAQLISHTGSNISDQVSSSISLPTIATTLRALTADSATKTDALLRASGYRRVPASWSARQI